MGSPYGFLIYPYVIFNIRSMQELHCKIKARRYACYYGVYEWHESRYKKANLCQGEIMKLRSIQLLVDDEGGIIMGKGRMDILDSIDRTGSINKTAKEMKMSYKSVWSKIKSTETHFGRAIVHADRASGTRLTEAGRTLLESYRELNRQCMASDDEIFARIFGKKPM
tara:strand:+ start:382 stop:882 length:501 start_codon:yes stop_codon:yes gene_type:complete